MYNLLDFDSTQFFRCVNLILFTVKSRSVLTSDFGNSQVCSVETLFAHLFTRQIGTVQYSKDKSECHREEASSSLRAIRVRIPEKSRIVYLGTAFFCVFVITEYLIIYRIVVAKLSSMRLNVSRNYLLLFAYVTVNEYNILGTNLVGIFFLLLSASVSLLCRCHNLLLSS